MKKIKWIGMGLIVITATSFFASCGGGGGDTTLVDTIQLDSLTKNEYREKVNEQTQHIVKIVDFMNELNWDSIEYDSTRLLILQDRAKAAKEAHTAAGSSFNGFKLIHLSQFQDFGAKMTSDLATKTEWDWMTANNPPPAAWNLNESSAIDDETLKTAAENADKLYRDGVIGIVMEDSSTFKSFMPKVTTSSEFESGLYLGYTFFFDIKSHEMVYYTPILVSNSDEVTFYEGQFQSSIDQDFKKNFDNYIDKEFQNSIGDEVVQSNYYL